MQPTGLPGHGMRQQVGSEQRQNLFMQANHDPIIFAGFLSVCADVVSGWIESECGEVVI